MKTFLVGVREVHVSLVRVDAENKEDAITNLCAGQGDEIALEYSHTLEEDLWTVEEFKEVNN